MKRQVIIFNSTIKYKKKQMQFNCTRTSEACLADANQFPAFTALYTTLYATTALCCLFASKPQYD